MYTDGHLVVCDRLMDAHGQHPATAAAAYYQQMESPPCYTIATGLPTYDEALHHHQHFSYGMKFTYPSITAVHHHPAIAGLYATNCNSNNNNNHTTTTITSMLKQQQSGGQCQRQQLMKQKSYKVSPLPGEADAEEAVAVDVPATYDIAELHGLNIPAAALGVAAPLLGVNASTEKSVTLEEVITIRLDEMTPTATLAATTAATRATRRPTLFYNDVQRGSSGKEEQQCSAVTIA
ncbi:protein commissureless 1-like [Rhagoletis pomonella]|uniref:protein commissureless 1-like n=1 Tax=Rhagoletis pomonella TaxID=28610 RepID=UPI00177CB9DF|nr:protein commissureless 1-like [Rhagoletis pomonella]